NKNEWRSPQGRTINVSVSPLSLCYRTKCRTNQEQRKSHVRAIAREWESLSCHEVYRVADGGKQNTQDVLGPLWILCDTDSNELRDSEQNHQYGNKSNRKNYKNPGYQS